MKKRTIWIIAIVMGISFCALLVFQLRYFEQMLRLHREQFNSSVERSLTHVTRQLEMDETMKALRADVASNLPDTVQLATDPMLQGGSLGIHQDLLTASADTTKGRMNAGQNGLFLKMPNLRSFYNVSQQMRNELRSRYLYQRVLLDKVIYDILYTQSEKPIEETVNFKALDQRLKSELKRNGVTLPYHFRVTSRSGTVLYTCPDYSSKGEDQAYKQVLMPNNPPQNTGILLIHFPDMQRYIFRSVKLLLPAIIFTLILFITFLFTIVIIFRQKRISEIKNDFINNMTHELKTPVSSISLATQMLLDPAVPKTEKMTAHLSGIISDETKRLRMLIEKVLQTSVFEGRKVQYKNKEIDANKLVTDAADTFGIKVKQLGGTLETDIRATDSVIFGDQMHMTNVLFNLMDNAVKYRREDVDFRLSVATFNEHDKLHITITDNGVGIKKENLKKVFDKFYRVHTGNLHNVKGFGLGLAYVKGIITAMHGTIHAESEFSKGTKFIIILPIIKD
jgi:two-component system phosphate regulon sensor histidine kinase PhoR